MSWHPAYGHPNDSLDILVTLPSGLQIPLDPLTQEPQLLQVRDWQDTWRVCTTSILLVATRRAPVEELLDMGFYWRWESPEALLYDNAYEIEEAVRHLGLASQRVSRLTGFARDYLAEKPIRQCFGVGPYVEAAYRLVHLKDQWCETDDQALMLYRAWLRTLPDDPMRWARG